jgi:heme exporter protein D
MMKLTTILGPHAPFIVTAYAAAPLVIAALIFWVAVDYSTQQRIIAELEKRGVKRRSARAKK